MTRNKFKVVHDMGTTFVDAERLERINDGLGIALFSGGQLAAVFPKIEYVWVDFANPPAQPAQAVEAIATVELVAGEALLVGCPLTDAIERTASMIENAQGKVGETLHSHLQALLAEQRGQLFRAPAPVRDVIGTV